MDHEDLWCVSYGIVLPIFSPLLLTRAQGIGCHFGIGTLLFLLSSPCLSFWVCNLLGVELKAQHRDRYSSLFLPGTAEKRGRGRSISVTCESGSAGLYTEAAAQQEFSHSHLAASVTVYIVMDCCGWLVYSQPY